MKRFLFVAVLALVLAPAAAACNTHPTLAAMEGQIMCPVCGTTLDQSDSPAARQIEREIARRIAAGDSDCQIKDRLAAQSIEVRRLEQIQPSMEDVFVAMIEAEDRRAA